MKKFSLMLSVIACLLSASLFANANPIDENTKIIKVFTVEEVVEYSQSNNEFETIESVRLLQRGEEFLLEVTGVNLDGKSVTILSADDFEMLPCGTCHYSFNEEGHKIITGQFSGCIQCEAGSNPGPE